MKKWIAGCLALVMLFTACTVFAEEAENSKPVAAERTEVVFYMGDAESAVASPLCLLNGVEDLPYVRSDDLSALLTLIYRTSLADSGYALTAEAEPDLHTLTLRRENGAYMEIDFAHNEIVFNDYDRFLHDSSPSSLVEILYTGGIRVEDEPLLFTAFPDKSFDRTGSYLFLLLDDYSIDLPEADGYGYVPLQLISDLLIAPVASLSLFYNGRAMFLANGGLFGGEEGRTPLGELYYSAKPRTRSEELAEYGYHELCLALDCLYGLKEIHDIRRFDQFLWQTGLDVGLRDLNPAEADNALAKLLNYYLDDQHSSFYDYSWMTGNSEDDIVLGPSAVRYEANLEVYAAARSKYLGERPDAYTEVGNTAYITFDRFTSSDWGDYYERENVPEEEEDTIDLIIRAHREITRKKSPIENVVIDLTCNGGGSVDAAVFALCWLLGDASLCITDMASGAVSNVFYRADVNLDGRYDEKDTIGDRNVFCLITPASFSCGNVLPAMLKDLPDATLVGKTSGGGSCMVQPLSTAWGTVFQISGHYRMSRFQNGVSYDTDRGIEPDVYLASPESFYDREALTEFLSGLR